MVARVGEVLGAIRWDRAAVEEFLGRLLTQPKRARELPAAVARRCRRTPSRAASRARPRSRWRCRAAGSCAAAGSSSTARRTASTGHAAAFVALVGARALPLPLGADDAALALLYDWYRAGWLR